MDRFSLGMAFIAIFAGTLKVYSQTHSELVISKSFESTDEKNEPAAVSLTIPAGHSSSFLINGGIGFEISRTKIRPDGSLSYQNVFTSFVVGNYNSLVTEKQRNFKMGESFSHLIGRNSTLRSVGDGLNRVIRSNFFTIDHSIEYVRDLEDPAHSLVYTLYFSQVKIQKGGLYINKYQGEKKWQTFVGYNLGFEFQDRLVSQEPVLKGYSWRNYHNGILRLALRTADANNINNYVRIAEVGVDYVGRYQLARSTDSREGYLPLFNAELSIYPAKQQNFSIGFSYNAGSDPLNGLKNQHFYLLALKFKTKN